MWFLLQNIALKPTPFRSHFRSSLPRYIPCQTWGITGSKDTSTFAINKPLWCCLVNTRAGCVRVYCLCLPASGYFSINSLAPGRSYCDFKNVIFNLVSLIGILKPSYDNVLRWMSTDLTDDKSALVSGNGLLPPGNKPLPEPVSTRFPTPYGVTRPQWIEVMHYQWQARGNPFYKIRWLKDHFVFIPRIAISGNISWHWYREHRTMTSKSFMPTAPPCIDNSWRSSTLPRSRFGYLQPDTFAWEWTPISIGQNQIIGSFVATDFQRYFYFNQNQNFIVYVNKNCPYNF